MKLASKLAVTRELRAKRYAEGREELQQFYCAAKTAPARAALKHALSGLDRAYRLSTNHGGQPGDWRKKEAKFKEKNNLARQAATNGRQRWTSQHDEMVMGALMPDAEIARLIGRSIKAVNVRRVNLNKKRGRP